MRTILFVVLLIIAITENVQCRKSTFCPKVEPMEGFEWEPVT